MNDIISLLKKESTLNDDEINKLIKKAQSSKKSFLVELENAGVVKDNLLIETYAKSVKCQSIDLNKAKLQAEIVKLIPKDIAKKFSMIAIEKKDGKLIVATSDPKNLSSFDSVRFKTGMTPVFLVSLDSQIQSKLEKFYGSLNITEDENSKNSNSADTVSRTIIGTGSDDEGPIVTLVNDVLIQCKTKGASDIHVEPYETSLRIRLRIDGSLVEIAKPPVGMKNALISRIKIMSGLNIAETRLPQDGAINVTVNREPIDFRVNTLPTVYGEKIVMRILDKSNLQVDMTQLGFEVKQLQNFKKSIQSPNGMVLVTGPTGSGKTTTLYSALQELNTEDANVMTAEDPVEYSLPGINQVQVKPEIGLNFSSALRAFLRQDPDIIMVGEIRDLETAEIAMKAALTGHLVLSTLHTNSASDTISRLLNMGAAPFNLCAALNCITAQRLLRKICTQCTIDDDSVTENQLIEIGIPSKFASKVRAKKGEGCKNCSGSGYKGRVAVHEVLIMSGIIRDSILRGDPASKIKNTAMKSGMHSLRQSALTKMLRGETSIIEVIKSTSSDNE